MHVKLRKFVLLGPHLTGKVGPGRRFFAWPLDLYVWVRVSCRYGDIGVGVSVGMGTGLRL